MDSVRRIKQEDMSIKADKRCEPTTTSNNVNNLERQEILRKRKERRQLKKEEQRILKEQKKLEEKLIKTSDKIRIITPQEIENFNQSSSTPLQRLPKVKIRKFSQKYNLLDFIIERREHRKPVKKIESRTPAKINKGKKREINKPKCKSRLKRLILENRSIKRESFEIEQTNSVPSIEESIQRLKQLSISNSDTSTSENHKIHSRKFRSYCDNITSKELCTLTEDLLKDLFRFQKRAYEKNEIKARAHRRYVVGFKEVQRQLAVGKIKLVIIAPDCEQCTIEGGLDATIEAIKASCKTQEIPYVFSVRKRHLGYILLKKVPVSCVGILSYDGSQGKFRELLDQLQIDKDNYIKLT